MKFFKFTGRLLTMLSRGEFTSMMFEISRRLPPTLIMFNKAVLLRSEVIDVPPAEDSPVKVRRATSEDVPEIVRIGGLAPDHIESMLDSGAVCFMASENGGPPLAYTWSAYGRCFIRGVGYEHDFEGKYDYSYFNFTLPEARGKGIYRAIKRVSAEYADSLGINRFSALIEFTNEYSLKLHEKMGYEPFIDILFFKLLGLRICRSRNHDTGKSQTRLFIKEPQGNITFI